MIATPLLSLDLATRTGWAVSTQLGGVHHSGFFDVPAGRWAQRLAQFTLSLAGKLGAWRPANVVVERPGHGKTRDVVRVLSSLYKIAEEEVAAVDARLHPVAPNTLKKWATGSGKATKPQMVAAARARGYAVKDDNEADAILLALYGREELGL